MINLQSVFNTHTLPHCQFTECNLTQLLKIIKVHTKFLVQEQHNFNVMFKSKFFIISQTLFPAIKILISPKTENIVKWSKIIKSQWKFQMPILKLKSIHQCFLCPYECQSSMLYASMLSNFHKHLRSHDADKACHKEGYITQTTNILRIHVFVLSPHCLAWFYFFPNVINKLTHFQLRWAKKQNK